MPDRFHRRARVFDERADYSAPTSRRNRPSYYQRVNRQHIHGAECSEDDHQEALIDWANDTEALQTDQRIKEALHWLHHVSNGKWRGKMVKGRGGVMLPPVAAFRLKMMGVKPGVFDLRLDYPIHRRGPTARAADVTLSYSGLLLEMKSDRGVLSAEQRRFKAYMDTLGFLSRPCRTWQAGAKIITGYMDLKVIAPVYVLCQNSLISVRDGHSLLALENIDD